MQHADRMRGRDTVHDAQKELEPLRRRKRRECALALRPLRKIRPPVFVFEKERWRLEIPIEQLREEPLLAEVFPQQPRERRLALQGGKPLAVGTELVDPLFTRLRVPREPHLACHRAAQDGFEREVRPARHGHARGQLELAHPPMPYGRAFERAGEAVAHPRLSDDAIRILRAECATQLGDGVGDHVLDGGSSLPDDFEQLVLGDDLAGMRQQARENLERLALHIHRRIAHPQLEARFIEVGRAEPVAEERRGRRAFDTLGHEGRISAAGAVSFSGGSGGF